MALIKVQSEGINLADNFAFSGTVSGAGGGAWVKIGDTVTASNTSSIDFDNLSSTYQYYCIIGSQVKPSSISPDFYMNSGVGAGTYATAKTSVYVDAYNNEADNSLASPTASASSSIGYNTGNQAIMKNCADNGIYGRAGNFRAYLCAYGQGGNYASYDVFSAHWTNNNYVNAVRVTGMVQGSADSVRFIYSGGTIATGQFTLYGIAQ
tara:strand:- start:60 stop:683 length:624 start_codon:yes stop_codon:yes gene_type:complete